MPFIKATGGGATAREIRTRHATLAAEPRVQPPSAARATEVRIVAANLIRDACLPGWTIEADVTVTVGTIATGGIAGPSPSKAVPTPWAAVFAASAASHAIAGTLIRAGLVAGPTGEFTVQLAAHQSAGAGISTQAIGLAHTVGAAFGIVRAGHMMVWPADAHRFAENRIEVHYAIFHAVIKRPVFAGSVVRNTTGMRTARGVEQVFFTRRTFQPACAPA